MENDFFIDVILFMPYNVDCYIQAPDLDIDLIRNLIVSCNIPYYERVKLTPNSKAQIINLESQFQISQWIQSMEIRKDSELLFEGYDSVNYGLFSKNITIPYWFKNKHINDFSISHNW